MATPEEAERAWVERRMRVTTRIEWHEQQFLDGLAGDIHQRLLTVAILLKDKITANISLPVGKDSNGNVVVRSRVGEFPRAETTLLMKDIFYDKVEDYTFIVGTSLDYGLYLELKGRSFLMRTLMEEFDRITRVVIQPLDE